MVMKQQVLEEARDETITPCLSASAKSLARCLQISGASSPPVNEKIINIYNINFFWPFFITILYIL